MLILMPDLQTTTQDPVVDLATICQAYDQPFQLLFTQPLPELRLLLHRDGLLEQSWWNVFDTIQAIHSRTGLPKSAAEIAVPPDATPLVTWPETAWYRGDDKVMSLFFHESGCVWRVIYYEAQGRHVDQYDDRGIRLTTTWQDDQGQQTKKCWYSEFGDVVMTQDATGITIASAHRERFRLAQYPDLDAIVLECLQRWVMAQQQQPVVIRTYSSAAVAFNQQLGDFARTAYMMTQDAQAQALSLPLIKAGDRFVFPTGVDRDFFLAQYSPKEQAVADRITSQSAVIMRYPTALTLGLSNESPNMLIAWRLGELDAHAWGQLLGQAVDQLSKDDAKTLMVMANNDDQVEAVQSAFIQTVSAQLDVDMASPAYQRVETYMLLKARNQLTPDLEKSFTADKAAPEWPQLVSAYELLQRLGVAALTTRRAQFKLLQEARVYIDSGALPDLWLQSQAVSAGVPQIIRREDEFLLMGINGVVCLELDALFPAAGRFLDRLRKWNQALVADAALLEEFTADKLLTQWQEILE